MSSMFIKIARQSTSQVLITRLVLDTVCKVDMEVEPVTARHFDRGACCPAAAR